VSKIYGGIFDFDLKSEKLEQVNAELEDPTVWDDPKRAQDLGKEKKSLENIVDSLTNIRSGLRDAGDLLDMAREENDEDTLLAVEADAHALQKQVEAMEFRRMFSNPLDKNSCFIDIQAGAGGTEAQDWASMLLRQYLRYCERKGFKTEILEQSDGEVAGIKTATIKVEGDHAYGFLRTETGVHRLVRKSPFDSANGRHTSFSSLFVYPEVDDSISIEVNPADVRVDTYRASGAGGQHVNTTDSAVRITHIPTGIVVASQNDRSQHKNRATAMNMLKARMFEREMAIREAAASGEYQEKSEIGWGHQIRSYVLQPYQMVKDLRTGVVSTSPDAVLDGAIDPFISAALAQRVTGETVEIEDVE
jgi:peptide chain release factor 2